MEKPFLLIMGVEYLSYQPLSSTEHWKGTFSTLQEIKDLVSGYDGTVGNYYDCKGYIFGGRMYDWVEVIDLREWVK